MFNPKYIAGALIMAVVLLSCCKPAGVESEQTPSSPPVSATPSDAPSRPLVYEPRKRPELRSESNTGEPTSDGEFVLDDPADEDELFFKKVYDAWKAELILLVGEEPTPLSVMERYGNPVMKRPIPGFDADFSEDRSVWSFAKGFEVDVWTEDGVSEIQNYILFLPECKLRLSTGVCIGSLSEDVFEAYSDMISDVITDEASEDTLLSIDDLMFFIIRDGTVAAIYVSTGCADFYHLGYPPFE